MQLLVNGSPVSEYTKDGNTYVEGRKNSEYTIRVRNHTGDRIVVVPTVDGLSIINGKPGNYDSPGHILSAYETYEFTGWRINQEQTKKFIFTKHNKSYSEKTGQGTSNLGVIGLVAFKEQWKSRYVPYIPPYWPRPRYYSDIWYENWSGSHGVGSVNIGSSGGTGGNINTSLKGSSLQSRDFGMTQRSATMELKAEAYNAAMPVASVGTGMGKKQESKITNVSFDREINPFVTLQMYYYEKKQLIAMGVTKKIDKNKPQAFPSQYCSEI